MNELRVRAPATTANLGPGFDCAACALDLWNELVVGEGNAVTIAGEGAGELPEGPENLALRAFALLAPVEGRSFAFANRIPLGRGLGSSAAAVALGLVAGARAAGREVVPGELLAVGRPARGPCGQPRCRTRRGALPDMGGERHPASRADRRWPAARAGRRHPAERVATAASRAALPAQVSHADASFTAGRAALLGAGAATGDARLFATALADRLHEPFRAATAPLLQAVREARPTGALGATLSGSGPTVIVWVEPGRGAECASDLAGRFRSARVVVLAPSAEGAVS